MSSDIDLIVAFDSNTLTYFLEGNDGDFGLTANDPLNPQRVAAVRLFLHCKTVIVPTVRTEALAIPNTPKQQKHIGFIDSQFGEFIPSAPQERSIARRADELLAYHSNGLNDCRILAEAEEDGNIRVLVTWDTDFTNNLTPHARIRLESPDAYWSMLNIPRGAPPRWVPAAGHPLATETWWRWER